MIRSFFSHAAAQPSCQFAALKSPADSHEMASRSAYRQPAKASLPVPDIRSPVRSAIWIECRRHPSDAMPAA